MNECENEPCDQKCTNTRGSFTCGCGARYRLNDDGRTCSGESATHANTIFLSLVTATDLIYMFPFCIV